MAASDHWTIERLLRWTTDFLRERGASNARLDAEVLLAHARGCQRIELYTAYGEVASEQLRADFRDLVRQRGEGTPVAYLVGQREFYSLPFYVTPEVLIPRPETEHLVVTVLDKAKDMPEVRAIADVGTGSGIIAVCCAKYLPSATVWALDISDSALVVARRNVERHELAARINLVQSDLLTGLANDAELDFVVSNPPYVSESEYDKLAPDVRNFEPRSALVAGPTGTEIIANLVAQAATRLRSGGWLILEVSPMIASAVTTMLAHAPQFDDVSTTPDLAGLPRVVSARRAE